MRFNSLNYISMFSEMAYKSSGDEAGILWVFSPEVVYCA